MVTLLKTTSYYFHFVVLCSLVLTLLLVSFPFGAFGEVANILTGYQCINAESEITVFSEPSEAARTMGVLPQNTIFQVVDEKDDWLKISLQDSGVPSLTTGWISKETIRKISYFDGLETAVVHNPDLSDRLHLREQPKVSSQSLGKYYNGVVVAILEDYSDSEWMKVQIGSLVGYMQTKYLETGVASASVTSARPSVMVSNRSGKGLNLREYPRTSSTLLGLYPNGTQALVLGITEKWYHVQIGDEFGFMSAHGIEPRLQYAGSVVPSPSKSDTVAQNATVTSDVHMYKYDSENSLEVITTLPSGEVVSVLSSDSNGWCKVSNGIREGYVLTKYLNFE